MPLPAAPPHDLAPQGEVWEFNQLDKLGRHTTTVLGSPQLIETPEGKAIEFDGKGDALFLDTNPLAGLKQFTVEVVFRPSADGPKEQRFFHFQEEGSESRLLFETRLPGDKRWFLDSFLQSRDKGYTLFAEKSTHPIGPWYHAAVVVDGRTMRHFVNGQEELKSDIEFQPLGKGQTSLGVRINKVFWFQGAIRKVRITSRPLSPKEFLKP
jgi:hypothetical protein